MSAAAIMAAALAAGSATALASHPLPARGSTSVSFPGSHSSHGGPDPDMGLLLRLRPVLSGLGFVAGWVLLGGVVGIFGGLVIAVLSWRVLGRTEGPAVRRRREQLRADLPVAIHLLAEVLRTGAAVEQALGVVAEAMPGPCGDALAALERRLGLGADPVTVWDELSEDAELAGLGRGLGRAHETGAAVADAIEALASELRARARSEVEQRARSVDVRASAPLGACFLPAFVLLGVVPLVAGVFGSLHLFD